MTENGKIILGLCSGFAMGLVTGIVSVKKYFKNIYQKAADKEIEDMKDYYEIRKNWEIGHSEDSEQMPDYDPETLGIEMSKLKDRVNNKKEKTQYNNMYSGELDTDNEDNDQIASKEDKANESHEENRHKKPEVIPESALEDLPSNIDSQTLFLYTGDGIITDDCDNVVDEPSYLIGASLEKVDLNNLDEQAIFIVNWELGVCYEIQVIDSDYPGYNPSDGF